MFLSLQTTPGTAARSAGSSVGGSFATDHARHDCTALITRLQRGIDGEAIKWPPCARRGCACHPALGHLVPAGVELATRRLAALDQRTASISSRVRARTNQHVPATRTNQPLPSAIPAVARAAAHAVAPNAPSDNGTGGQDLTRRSAPHSGRPEPIPAHHLHLTAASARLSAQE